MITQEQLEAKAQELIFRLKGDGAVLTNLTDDQIFALLAYELWKDGRDWDDELASLAEGHPDMQFKKREDCVHYLKTVFGY